MHSDDDLSTLSKDVFQPDAIDGAEFKNKLWKVLQEEDGPHIVTHVGPARTFIYVFGVFFLVFTWGRCIVVEGPGR